MNPQVYLHLVGICCVHNTNAVVNCMTLIGTMYIVIRHKQTERSPALGRQQFTNVPFSNITTIQAKTTSALRSYQRPYR